MLIKSSFFELKNFYNLAHQGDNLTAGIEIDCADIAEDGDTAAVLIRGVDGSSYPALSTFEDKQLRYSFTSADLKYPGNIYLQAAIYGADGKIKHSKVAALHIGKSIAGDEEPPEAFKAWLDEAVEALEELKHSGGGGGAADWSHLREKPFETIGDGLKVEDGALETDLPEWSRQPNKPTYTAAEIADGDSNVGAELAGLKEELASKAEKTDIPESLPSPNTLTFTGAVSGAYDGSVPLTVNIPQGGGGGGRKLIAELHIDGNPTYDVLGFDADANALIVEDATGIPTILGGNYIMSARCKLKNYIGALYTDAPAAAYSANRAVHIGDNRVQLYAQGGTTPISIVLNGAENWSNVVIEQINTRIEFMEIPVECGKKYEIEGYGEMDLSFVATDDNDNNYGRAGDRYTLRTHAQGSIIVATDFELTSFRGAIKANEFQTAPALIKAFWNEIDEGRVLVTSELFRVGKETNNIIRMQVYHSACLVNTVSGLKCFRLKAGGYSIFSNGSYFKVYEVD